MNYDRIKNIGIVLGAFLAAVSTIGVIWSNMVEPAFAQYVQTVADSAVQQRFRKLELGVTKQEATLEALKKQSTRTYLELSVAREKQKGLVEDQKQLLEDNRRIIILLQQLQASRP